MGSKKGIVESSLLEVVIRLTARFAHHNVGKEGYQAKKGIFESLLRLVRRAMNRVILLLHPQLRVEVECQ